MATFVGVHIPDLSSKVDFFDVLYLGIFIVLSPAFNPQFYKWPNLFPCPFERGHVCCPPFLLATTCLFMTVCYCPQGRGGEPFVCGGLDDG